MLDEINLNSFGGGRTQLTPGASGHHPATITASPRQSFNLIFLSLAVAVAEFSQSNLLSTIHSFILTLLPDIFIFIAKNDVFHINDMKS